jgi:hypothetical protein
LQVRTREQTPAQWAITHNNLGAALRDQAAIAEGAAQARLLTEAIQAYHAALQVYRPEWMAGRFFSGSAQIIGLLLNLASLSVEKGKKEMLLSEAHYHLERIVSHSQTTSNAEQQAFIQTLAQAIQDALHDDE